MWTETHEFFAEAQFEGPGAPSSWLVHATRLRDFAAVRAGEAALRLVSDAGEVVASAPLLRPGIYRIETPPLAAGTWTATFAITDPEWAGSAELGSFALPLVPSHDEAPEGISFLKEQQWLVPFGVTAAARGSVRSTVTALGRLAAAPGHDAELRAPVDGVLRLAREGGLAPGDRVAAGELIATVVQLAPDRDEGALRRDLEAAEAALRLAEAELARLEPLVAQGVVGTARLTAAEGARDAARAERDGARARLGQLGAARSVGEGGAAIPLHAPIAGRVAATVLVDGMQVSAGQVLAQVTDVARLVVDAHVPESAIALVPGFVHATVHLTGVEQPLDVAIPTPLQVTGSVDPTTHTIEVRVPIDAPAAPVAPGQSARVEFGYGEATDALVVPRGAISDENGAPVVYVQHSGELFVRRPIRAGRRFGESVEVLDGLTVGERVVTEGAWLVRLAGSSGELPAHGHAH